MLRVGGVSVLRQQLRLVLALECERVVCLGSGISPELVELQHLVEKAGASFHVISAPRALSGLVTAADEVIALDDGLLAPGAELATLLGRGQGVLVQPVEQGLDAGFERIDLNHASAGAMRIPGRLVERLAELPADCNAISALQRIALQAGVPQRPIPGAGQRGPIWSLVRQEADALALEPLWIRLRTHQDRPLGPSRWLALASVRRFGPALLHAGSGAGMLAIGAALLALLGLGAGWCGLVPLGLGACALGWILRHAAILLARIEDDQRAEASRALSSDAAYGWLLDGIVVALIAWGSDLPAMVPQYVRYFPGIMLVALLRILPRTLGMRWGAWLDDRALLAVLLAGATISGLGDEAVRALAIGLALAGILIPRGDSELT